MNVFEYILIAWLKKIFRILLTELLFGVFVLEYEKKS